MRLLKIFGTREKTDQTGVSKESRVILAQQEEQLERLVGETADLAGELRDEDLEHVNGGVHWLRSSSSLL